MPSNGCRNDLPRSFQSMKPSILPTLASVLLPLVPLAAQDGANPFEKSGGTSGASTPRGPVSNRAGVLLQEQFLVPPDLLAGWLDSRKSPLEATELRQALQSWTGEGKASVDHTALLAGTVGSPLENEQVLEQVYATEYETVPSADWPVPIAFETRNVGQTFNGRLLLSETGKPARFECDSSVVEALPSTTLDTIPVVKATRQPGDVFIPTFRSWRSESQPRRVAPFTPPDPFAGPDPMAPPSEKPATDSTFETGPVRLLGVFDPLPQDRAAGIPSRVIFVRGSVATEETPSFKPEGTYTVSVQVVRVNRKALDPWTSQNDLLKVPALAHAAAEQWIKDGQAEVLRRFTTSGPADHQLAVESVDEFIYATVWEPRKREVSRDPKSPPPPSLLPAVPREFETRNVGMTFHCQWTPGENDGSFRCEFESVVKLGDSIHHRVLVDDMWVPDVLFPAFASQKIASSMRLPRGEWILMGTGGEHLPDRSVDKTHRLLVFVKAE